MRKLRIAIGDRSYTVEVGDTQASPINVIVNGETFSVDVQSLDEAAVPAATTPAPASGPSIKTADGPSQVTAPMPGTVLDIAVQVNDTVQENQVLCALEAMKMKSPIRSLQTGIIRQVQVHDGQKVDYGDLLFVVE